MKKTPIARAARSLEITCALLTAALAITAARYLIPALLPLLLGAAIAALARPAALALAKRTRLPEKGASMVTLGMFYLLAAALAALFFTILLVQFYDLLTRLPDLCVRHLGPVLEQMQDSFDALALRFLSPESLQAFSEAVFDATRQMALDGSAYLVGWVASLVSKLPMLLLSGMFTIVISILFSLNYSQAGAFLRELAGKKFTPLLLELQTFLRETVWQFVRAYTILMAITFVELSIGLWLLGFDYVFPLAAVISLVDLLPLVGSGIVLVPWGLALLAVGNTSGAGILILYCVMGFIRNILEPRIVSGQIGLHPIITISAMYAGLRLGGLWGMLLSPVLVLAFLRLGKCYFGSREERPAASKQVERIKKRDGKSG